MVRLILAAATIITVKLVMCIAYQSNEFNHCIHFAVECLGKQVSNSEISHQLLSAHGTRREWLLVTPVPSLWR